MNTNKQRNKFYLYISIKKLYILLELNILINHEMKVSILKSN